MLGYRTPSLAARALAAFAAGLFVGLFGPLSDWSIFWPAVGFLAAGGLLPRGRILVVVGVVGAWHGAVGRATDRSRCARVLAAGEGQIEVELLEPAPPNRPASARLVGRRCGGSVTVRHRLGDTLWAGTRARLDGRWIPRPSRWRPADGLFAVRSAHGVASPRPAGGPALVRNWLLRSIGSLYGGRAGMVEALVLGSRGTIDPAVGQGFARSGLVHLLSISGFHVGVVWAWVILLLGALGRRRAAPWVAAGLIACYVAFIGMPAPAVRATLLAVLSAIETGRQRRVAVGAMSAVVAWLVLLADPWAMTDLGAWLSVAAMWGAIVGGRWVEGRGRSSAVGSILASSIGATVATAPLSALMFGSVSLIGVVANVVAIPLAGIALPPTLLSVPIAAVWRGLAETLAAGSGALLHLLELLAAVASRLPFAALTFEPGAGPALAAIAVAGLVVWVFGRRNHWAEAGRRAGWVSGIALLASLVAGAADGFRDHPGPALHFLDVGQGDAALIETSRGRWILIDAGPIDSRGDAGRRVIVPFLRRHGVRRLAVAVLSHAHRDHFGGLPAVLESVPAEMVVEPGLPVADREYLSLLDGLDDRAIPWRGLRSGDRLVVDEVVLDVLHPDPRWAGWGVDVNENSIVLHLAVGRFDALLTGDAGWPVEETLASRLGAVELLKVGHHGSRTATGDELLARLHPRAAVISVGANNYGHPAPETLARLAGAGVATWRTDRDGVVTVRIADPLLRVTSRRGDTTLTFHD